MIPHLKTSTPYLTILLISSMNVAGGIVILIDGSAINVTTMSSFKVMSVPTVVVGLVMLAIGLSTAVNCFFRTSYLYSFATVAIQFALLGFYAGGSLVAIKNSMFADLVPRSQSFLIVDQRYPIVLLILHGIALFKIHMSKYNWQIMQGGLHRG